MEAKVPLKRTQQNQSIIFLALKKNSLSVHFSPKDGSVLKGDFMQNNLKLLIEELFQIFIFLK